MQRILNISFARYDPTSRRVEAVFTLICPTHNCNGRIPFWNIFLEQNDDRSLIFLSDKDLLRKACPECGVIVEITHDTTNLLIRRAHEFLTEIVKLSRP